MIGRCFKCLVWCVCAFADLKKNKRLQDQMLERFGSADSSRESFLVISGWFAIVAGLTLVAFIAVVVAMVYWRFQHQVQDSVGAVVRANN